MIRLPVLVLLAAFSVGAVNSDTAKPPGPDLTTEPDLNDIFAAARAAADVAVTAGATYRVFELPALGLKVHAWTFDQSRFRASVAEQKMPKGSPVADMIGTGIFAINGGFFERGKEDKVLSPSGLLIARGKQLAAENDRAGSGIVYVGADGFVAIGYRKQLPDHAGMREAIQVGPMLVEPGGKVGILNKQHNRDRRSAICVRPGTFTAVVVEGGLSLFQLASLLAAPSASGGFGCQVALNLDGGPSTQAILRAPGHRTQIGGSPVENALVVSPNSG